MTRVAALPALQAASYSRHALHAEDRVWVEKNCYIDLWIEVIHALGCDPMAIMPFVVAVDFEGDQWTFFKPPLGEIRSLYGIETQELNVWRPLLDHTIEHLADGKLIATEADAFWLPDTQGTDYRGQHTKTTIVINDIDVDARRLGYFHNAGYFSLEGEDFERLFHLGEAPDPARLPLFAEWVRVNRVVRRAPGELRAMSRELLRAHLALRPSGNPVSRFEQRFAQDLPALTASGLARYHAWAFATIRQLGAAFELAAAHLRWLEDPELVGAAAAFDKISAGAKTFILKAARAVNAKRPLDAAPMFAEMADAWRSGMEIVAARVGG